MTTEIDQLKALTAYANVGVKMLQARILSVLALAGLIGLGCYVNYSPTWHGVVLCGILALVTIGAFRAESGNLDSGKEPQ